MDASGYRNHRERFDEPEMPPSCLDCYYRSWIGLDHWCCHPAIKRKIKKPQAKCAEHIYYDAKGRDKVAKLKIDEMRMSVDA